VDRAEIDQRFRHLNIIWIAMMLGVVTMAGVLYLFSTTAVSDLQVIEDRRLVRLLPWVVATMAGGLLLGRRLQAATPRRALPEARLARYQTARIATFAVQEAGGLFFSVAAFLAGEPVYVLAGAGVGLWGMLIARPKRNEVERLLRG
jgi:hypothetical protein